MERLKYINFPIVISIILAYAIQKYDGSSDYMLGGVIVALIGVAGTILANFFQYKKDSSKISEVKEDTSAMTPQVMNIARDTRETNDIVKVNLSSKLDKAKYDINEVKGGISELYKDTREILEDVRYRKRLNDEYKGTFSREIFILGIDDLYKKISYLENENRDLILKNKELKRSLIFNQKEIENLKERIEQYKNKDQDYDIDIGY